MVTKADPASLSNYELGTGRVLSIYLDVDQSKAANLNRGFEAALESELRMKANTFDSECERRDFEAAARAKDFVSKYVPGASAIVVYAKSIVQPLVEALDEYQRYGVVLVDRMRARLYTVALGKIEKYAEVQALGLVRHIKSAGKDNLHSQSSFQSRADEHVHSHLKRVVELLETKPFERLVLAGTTEMTGELYRILPKGMRGRVVGAVPVACTATDENVLAAVYKFEHKVERSYEICACREAS